MSNFFTDLMSSIFVAGPTPSIMLATNISFAALQLVLFSMLVATYSIHFLILSFLSGGLWYSINWFVVELKEAKRLEAEQKKNEEAAQGGSDTEPEPIPEVDESGSKEVEPIPVTGELRRVKKVSEAGSGTEASTEDEWEKVDETEKDV